MRDSELQAMSLLMNLALGIEHDSPELPEKTSFGKTMGKTLAGWWFQILFIFTPQLGKIPILTNIFQMG